jgi:hypothetical protein
MRLLKFFPVCAAAAALLAGCASYHLGPVGGAVAGEKSIEIFPFNNETLEPRLGDAVTQALRERFQADATYHLATHGNGDVVVTGVIKRYSPQGLSYLNKDVSTGGKLPRRHRRAHRRARTRQRKKRCSTGMWPATRWSTSARTWRIPNGRPRRCWRRTWRGTSPS